MVETLRSQSLREELECRMDAIESQLEMIEVKEEDNPSKAEIKKRKQQTRDENME